MDMYFTLDGLFRQHSHVGGMRSDSILFTRRGEKVHFDTGDYCASPNAVRVDV
jgi:hypothetical protein